ncbi:MAG: thiamine-phosphate kinase [Desulfobacteraceae bacterium]|nr:thiamine-phosphate kinase [Desulfobacteraceae bacterium]
MNLHQILRFYYITDNDAPSCPPLRQVEIAVAAGATMVQYRNKRFKLSDFPEAEAIRKVCGTHHVPFVVNDHILLAKALDADGVHLGQDDDAIALARTVLGPDAIIGISVSTLEELAKTGLAGCDYIGCGPVFATATKPDAHPVIGASGLKAVAGKSPVPVAAIGGIDAENARICFEYGAAGVAVISCISRALDPKAGADALAAVCGCPPRRLAAGWSDEFGLIEKLLRQCAPGLASGTAIRVPPGDDAALLAGVRNPVITTDTQREGVHFRRDWQALDEIGRKAVAITFSDLAASYARPLALFVNLSIPAHMPESDMEALYRGIDESLKSYGAALGGGNIASGPSFSLDLFAIGEGHPDIFPLRANARPGDGLYVTGPLGLARAGLECLRKNENGFPNLIQAFKCPEPRFDAAEILAGMGVVCVMDISDGLAGDAAHIATASGISITFDFSLFYLDPALSGYCADCGMDPVRLMLEGGEDYQLLFACPPETFARIQPLIPEAFAVGRCGVFSGQFITNLPENVKSYQHGSLH